MKGSGRHKLEHFFRTRETHTAILKGTVDECEIAFTFITPGTLPQNWCRVDNVRESLFTTPVQCCPRSLPFS